MPKRTTRQKKNRNMEAKKLKTEKTEDKKRLKSKFKKLYIHIYI